MKKTVLCFVTGSEMGGVGKAFLEFIRVAESQGYNVQVLLPYESDLKTTIIPSRYICGTVFKRPISNKLLRLCVQIINLVTRRYFYFRMVKKVEHDIFVVYQGMGCSHWYQYSKKPSVIFFHQRLFPDSTVGFVESLLRVLHARNFQRFTARVAISDIIAKSWQETYQLNEPPKTILNLVNVEEIIEKSLLSQNRIGKYNRPQLICVARLSSEKGILRLLEVSKRLWDEDYLFDLYLVGDGPLMGCVLDFVKKNMLQESLHVLGKQENPYPYMRAADLLVLPSYEEGLGLVLWESLIVNTPVLATRCGGAEEALKDGAWGTLVENSEGGLYEGVKYALTHLRQLKWLGDYDRIQKELVDQNGVMQERLISLLRGLEGR